MQGLGCALKDQSLCNLQVALIVCCKLVSISWFIGKVTIVIIHTKGLETLLNTTRELPSR